jgi:hypothetical protein
MVEILEVKMTKWLILNKYGIVIHTTYDCLDMVAWAGAGFEIETVKG